MSRIAEWFSKREPVHRAETQAEREAIYRFRYDVFIEELGRNYSGADHERRWLRNDEDEKPYTTLLYTGTPDGVTSTAQIRLWGPGQVPAKDFQTFSMHLLPGIETLRTGEIGRVLIRRTLRGKLLLPPLLRASYVLAADSMTDIGFFRCSPGLLRHYRTMVGARTYGGTLIEGGPSAQIPLMLILSDQEHFRRVNSIFAPLAKRCFGPGRRAPLDLLPFEDLFGRESISVDTDKVWREVEDRLLRDPKTLPSFLDEMPRESLRKLVRAGFVMDVAQDDFLTRQGARNEREMYVILDGVFEVIARERQVAVLATGDLFGEVAFFRESGARSASVRALTPGRVLVLRRKFLHDLLHEDPEAAWQILMNTSRILAERLAAVLAGPAPSPAEDELRDSGDGAPSRSLSQRE